MTRLRSLAISLCSALLFAGCGGDGDPPPGDSIEILSVTPTTATAGVRTQFTVNFRYTLASTSSGVVDLGFFVDDTNQLLSGQRLLVSAGTSSGSLTANADPADYTTSSAFAVGILLSQEPHPATWTPLARAKQAIAVSP